MTLYPGIESIPYTLRDLRVSACLTQEQLASLVGLSNRTISAFERGTRTPSIPDLDRLCVALGIRIDEFFAWEVE